MVRRLLALLYPFEWFAVLTTVAVVAFLRANNLRVGWFALRVTVPGMLGSLPKILVAGLAIQIVIAAVGRRSVRDYLSGFFRLESLALWLRVCLASILVTFAYPWLKVSVPLLNQRLWDSELFRLERFVHFGVAPNIFLVELFRGSPLLGVIDRWYSLWITSVFIAWAWAAAHPALDRRRNFVLGCAILSTAGAWIYVSLPALGPCYAFPELFAGVRDQLPHAAGVQAALAGNYAKMLAGRDGTLRQFNPYLGIAAMPSLHVGAHWLFALWARRFWRPLFWPCVAATALTFVGSVVTGWHYAIDGYVGMLLAWGAFRLALRLEPVAVETAQASDAGPADASPSSDEPALAAAGAATGSTP